MAAFALSEDGPLDIDLVARRAARADRRHDRAPARASCCAAWSRRWPPQHSPARVNFVLIDYKGGSAFAQCAELPHTVGMVTDLDEQLGERALRSLEAELRYRERVLREHRASDLIEYDRLVADRAAPRRCPACWWSSTSSPRSPPSCPTSSPRWSGSPSAGAASACTCCWPPSVRPGAVNENIRANTNLRVCLRVQTPQDSSDVIDSPAAAKIPRNQPGRAQVRLGPSELIPVQTALVSGITAGPGGRRRVHRAVRRRRRRRAPETAARPSPRRASDLQRLVAAAGEAFAGAHALRRPWLPPLPGERRPRRAAGDGARRARSAARRGLVVPLALADDPEAQAQYPIGWNLNAGNLLLYGIGGSGTTTALGTLALALAETADPGPRCTSTCSTSAPASWARSPACRTWAR